MTRPVLVDSDTLSNAMRGHPSALSHFQKYYRDFGRANISIVTRFEVLRGLKVKNARKQGKSFEAFCAANRVIPLSDAIVVRAAEVYADLYRKGALIGDADILIAATALEHGMDLATNNTKHFANIRGLTVQNWLVSSSA